MAIYIKGAGNLKKNVFIDNLKNLDSYGDLLDSVKSNKSPISVRGLSGESISHISYSLNRHLNKQDIITTITTPVLCHKLTAQWKGEIQKVQKLVYVKL